MIGFEYMSNDELNEKVHKILHPLSDGALVKNYTGDWSAMGPIIHKYGITVDGNGMAWNTSGFDDYQYFTNCLDEPLRAAVITFLKMDEQH